MTGKRRKLDERKYDHAQMRRPEKKEREKKEVTDPGLAEGRSLYV